MELIASILCDSSSAYEVEVIAADWATDIDKKKWYFIEWSFDSKVIVNDINDVVESMGGFLRYGIFED